MSAKYAFTKSLKEVRFLFCQTGSKSEGLRTFINRSYPTMKKNNPNVPILIREAQGTLPKVYARYDLGKETSKPLEGLTEKQIEEVVTQLVKAQA
ncbi:nadh-ubiquinone oxidoreductase 105 kda subunit [Ophiostoma piceae UAMH 11346]|uniref:Nadh-ubiquinone oxidoreductase 105 kDa subunit n=1 Tax=Ophiostoma piceae (strain UAMH 11346) TaxID=1262450 RepID=S3C993_OPHP1|nr:nadh-ubiquinone oxidoreductase 105 kda subunit [Ophiostoma piceae UAMH 11346]